MRVVAAQFQRYQKHACHVAVKGIEDARGDGGGDDALVRVLLDTATGGAPTISGTRRPLVFSNLELVLDGGGGGSGSSRQRSGGAGDVGGASRVKPVGKKKSDSIQPTPRGAHEGVTAVVPKFEDVAVDFGATQVRCADVARGGARVKRGARFMHGEPGYHAIPCTPCRRAWPAATQRW